jgi:Brp/Blh family beta-carotene 15,15'-monooxygenase
MKYSNFAIVASFFGLWLDSSFSKNTQLIFGFILILSFGIIHGANDLLLINYINKNNKPLSNLKLLFYYLIIVGLGGILFWIIPWFGLLLFILVSGYHFGEQQWQNLETGVVFKLFEFTYGLFILFLLFIFHIEEVQNVIFNIASISIPENYFSVGLLITSFLLVILGIYFVRINETFKNKWFLETFYLLVFTIIFKVSSLIWGFAIYFIIWHSIPSIINQVSYLNGSFNWKNFVVYIQNAFIYWIVSLIGIVVLYYLFRDVKLFNAIFFSFLAAITFPHVAVLFLVFKKNKKNRAF